jgi:hypothetical protein
MVYASLEAGASGIFFWTWYRSPRPWSNMVIAPVTTEIDRMAGAIRAGPVATGASVDRSDIGLTMFRDPATRDHYLVVIHHAAGDVSARLTLDGALGGARVTVDDRPVDVSGRTVRTDLGPFGVRVFRFHPRTG